MNKREQQTIARALAIMEKYAVYNGEAFNRAADAGRYFAMRLYGEKREHFEVAYLNAQNQLIETVRMFSGTINNAPVFPREIARKALELNAVAIVLAHNHPSGIAEPSQADKSITELIAEAAKLLDIRVLDHIIVGRAASTYSFAEHGLL